MTGKKKTAVSAPAIQRPAGIQQMGPDLYEELRAALLELNAAAAH